MARVDNPWTFKARLAFWTAIVAALVLVLWLLRDVLLPFVAACGIAYLLNPLATRLETRGLSRSASSSLILLVFVVLLLLALILLIPLLASQLSAFLRALPSLVTQLHAFAMSRLETYGDNPIAAYLTERLGGGTQRDIGAFLSQAASWSLGVVGSIWTSGQTIVSILGLSILTPVLAFYLLVDWPRMVATVDGWIPRPWTQTVRHLAREIDQVLAGFIRGQVSLCVALAIFYGAALTMAGLNFGLLIGVGAGIISFIPYIGSALGFVVAVGVAIVQFWPDYGSLALVAGIFIFGQTIEGYVLQPKLVGTSVGLHPVWLMFALFAFGSLLGFVGLLLAVPLAACIGVLLRFAIGRYMGSPLYTGDAPVPVPAAPPDQPA